MTLQKEFFNTQSFNPRPYFDNKIVNLSGASKFEKDTIFMPGRYRIELAPGFGWQNIFDPTDTRTFVSNMLHDENITIPFIIRAYCGSNPGTNGVGTNPYQGPFKVNGSTTTSSAVGIDVNHIFGAGGGNGRKPSMGDPYSAAGGNCLGNGNISTGLLTSYGGAGSCLHLLPVGGIFGTDYIRAYHAASNAGIPGSAYGGAAGGVGTNYGGGFATRGGNSPYGTGGTPIIYSSGIPTQLCTQGTGVGAGGKTATITINGSAATVALGAGAYFNGTTWIDEPGKVTNTGSSYIRVTYLGPLL